MRKHRSEDGGVALVLALALTVAGCSDGDADAGTEASPSKLPSLTSASTPTNTPTPPTPEERATAQLVKYLNVRDDALRNMKFAGRRFEELAGGQEFLTLQQRIIEYSTNEFSLSGEYEHTVGETRRRSDSTVLVDVCEDESGVELRTRDGKPVKRSLGGAPIPTTRTVQYTLKRTDGRWLVAASTYVLAENGQVQPC